jgi:hypothetical protein
MNVKFISLYGNPDKDGDGILDKEWFAENINVFSLPFPMVLSWQPSKTILKFQAHRLAGDKIISALETMLSAYSLEYIRARKLDRWGGCFNFRLIRGGNELSAHSWGTAVDINPDIGRLGNAEDARQYPRFIVESFTSEGFIWGGLWKRPDSMHFELKE